MSPATVNQGSLKETLINSSARCPELFAADCVNVPQRSYGCAFGPFPCQSQKAFGHRTNSFNQRFLKSVNLFFLRRCFSFNCKFSLWFKKNSWLFGKFILK
jgi:hypothetical protein